ncbi:MAG TPA: hypothetical protein VF175_06865, partial [Lacipirellula sp.]
LAFSLGGDVEGEQPSIVDGFVTEVGDVLCEAVLHALAARLGAGGETLDIALVDGAIASRGLLAAGDEREYDECDDGQSG